MVICLSCGEQVTEDVKDCPHCGKFLNLNHPTNTKTPAHGQRSNWWYGLPVVSGIFGGAVAYFVIHDDDPKKAKECLIIGIGMFAAWFMGLFF